MNADNPDAVSASSKDEKTSKETKSPETNVLLLKNWLEVLKNDNTKRITNLKPDNAWPELVEILFFTFEKLKLPWCCKYLATEIFLKFIALHFQEIHSYVNKQDSGKRVSTLKTVIQRTKKQLLLRAVSCCQIASKISGIKQALPLTRAWSFLQSMKQYYTKDSVLQAEVRVFRTLNYQVNLVTPMDYIDLLIRLLAVERKTLNIEAYTKTSAEFLDFIYLHKSTILQRYEEYQAYNHRQAKRSRKTVPEHANISNNYFLIGAACIAAAGFLYRGNAAAQISVQLARITEVAVDDILTLGALLFHLLLKTKVESDDTVTIKD